LIAGTSSGCGKTTVTLALMAALRAKGLEVAPFKVGPDYIDPGFHAVACGRPSDNLDGHLMDASTVRAVLRAGEERADIAVIEGVMGYYDGMHSRDFACSTWRMAADTRTPSLLVVDASGGAASAAATALGFLRFRRDSRLAGVLINRVSSRGHYELVRDAIVQYTGLQTVGYLPKDASLALESRHLGLIPAEETPEIKRRSRARRAWRLKRWTWTPSSASPLAPGLSGKRKPLPDRRGYRLGVARDAAFSFYYAENLRALRASGMELIEFSPLADARLPTASTGCTWAAASRGVCKALEENRAMRESMRAALSGGLRCYAECGGLLYLCETIDGHKMAGFFPIACRMTERLQRFGYADVSDRTGLNFPAHEFHHAVAEPLEAVPCAFRVARASDPSRTWDCGYEQGNTLAGFPHLHFGSHPELIGRLWP
jgi:cobyrinic acid a,c-diamide synthase